MDSERNSQRPPLLFSLLTRSVDTRTVAIVLAVCMAVVVGLRFRDVVSVGRALNGVRVAKAIRRDVDAECRFQVGLTEAVRQGVSPEAFASRFGEIRPFAVPAFRAGGKPYTHVYADLPRNRIYYLRFEDGRLTARRRERRWQPPAEIIDQWSR